MLKQDFHQVLDKFAEWKIGTQGAIANTTTAKVGRPRKTPKVEEIINEESQASGYPVVNKFIEQPTQCGWCEETVDGNCRKTYRKTTLDTVEIWRGKCDCGQIQYNQCLKLLLDK